MKQDAFGFIRVLCQLRKTLNDGEPLKEIVLSPHMFRKLMEISTMKRWYMGCTEPEISDGTFRMKIKGTPVRLGEKTYVY